MNESTPPPGVDITMAQWEIVRDILKTYAAQYEMLAFGSRVTHSAKRFSDLDLVIMSNKPLPLNIKADLAEAFSESDLPWFVDVVDWATTEDYFREIILKNYVVRQRP